MARCSCRPSSTKTPSDDGLFAYFSEVIQRVGGDIKIYLYHFPAQSAVPFGIDLIGRLLAAYPGKVKGIKDSSGDFANTKAYADHFARDGFEVYCGDDGALQKLLHAGGAGCITAAANVGSAVSAQVYANWDKPEGEQAQILLAAIRKAVTATPLIPGLKTLVARQYRRVRLDQYPPAPHEADLRRSGQTLRGVRCVRV